MNRERKGLNRDEIVAMYENGMTMNDIAEALGVTYNTISYHINKAGIGPGRGNRRKRIGQKSGQR